MYLYLFVLLNKFCFYYKIAATAITKNLDVGIKSDAGRDEKLIINFMWPNNKKGKYIPTVIVHLLSNINVALILAQFYSCKIANNIICNKEVTNYW